ncbi:MAG: hypothetical protein ACI4N3_01655 [Alphaproteobacteria bacterium]
MKGGLSIGITTEDWVDAPFVRELNIKFKCIDRNELKRYNDERKNH